jgi:phosphohistidine phosphatase
MIDASQPPSGAPEAGEPDSAVELYLLRHADAGDPAAWTGDDAERPLSGKGKRQARRLGDLLADLKLAPDLILTSPKVRASQTAKLVGRAVKVKPQLEEALAGGFEGKRLNAVLAANTSARRLILVGHDPDFSELVTWLTGAPIEVQKGAVARVDLAAMPARRRGGVLRWLLPPGALPR